jgi:hypothetical protein
MATRSERLTEFVVAGPPGEGQNVQVLCEDHVGTYLLPFPCQYSDGEWRNAQTGEAIAGAVVGWREFPARVAPRRPDVHRERDPSKGGA